MKMAILAIKERKMQALHFEKKSIGSVVVKLEIIILINNIMVLQMQLPSHYADACLARHRTMEWEKPSPTSFIWKSVFPDFLASFAISATVMVGHLENL